MIKVPPSGVTGPRNLNLQNEWVLSESYGQHVKSTYFSRFKTKPKMVPLNMTDPKKMAGAANR